MPLASAIQKLLGLLPPPALGTQILPSMLPSDLLAGVSDLGVVPVLDSAESPRKCVCVCMDVLKGRFAGLFSS